jgi:anti-sigma regulatory factor (Ser/Thr protein kinase)
MNMNPGTRPARSSRYDRSPDNGQFAGAGKLAATGPAGQAGDENGQTGQVGPIGQINRDTDHPDIPPRFRRSFAGQPDQVAAARHFVHGALAGCPALADAVLLASELATNAVQHSASGRGGAFVVAISHAPGRVRVTVTDGGSATRPIVAREPEELAVSGRGLVLVDALADRWGYASELDHPAASDAPANAAGRCPGADVSTEHCGAVWFELACS